MSDERVNVVFEFCVYAWIIDYTKYARVAKNGRPASGSALGDHPRLGVYVITSMGVTHGGGLGDNGRLFRRGRRARHVRGPLSAAGRARRTMNRRDYYINCTKEFARRCLSTWKIAW